MEWGGCALPALQHARRKEVSGLDIGGRERETLQVGLEPPPPVAAPAILEGAGALTEDRGIEKDAETVD